MATTMCESRPDTSESEMYFLVPRHAGGSSAASYPASKISMHTARSEAGARSLTLCTTVQQQPRPRYMIQEELEP